MQKLLVTGAGGFVGARVCQQWSGKFEFLTFPRGFLANADEADIRRFVTANRPDLILHTAALSDTGYCAAHPEESYRANVLLPEWLAKAAQEVGAKLVAFSSDQVYAGVTRPGPLPETLELAPANIYGQHKLEMEGRVLARCPDAVLLRATWMYDLPGYHLPIRGNLPLNLWKAALHGETVKFSSQDFRGVSYVREVIDKLLLSFDLPGGVYNFGSGNDCNMVETARQFADIMGISVKIEEADWPRNLTMSGEKPQKHGIAFASTPDALRMCLKDYGV